MEKQVTEAWLKDTGYVYLGEYGVANKDHRANQLWRWRDELIIYDPEDERIVWREWNEPRFQTLYCKTWNLGIGERSYNEKG